MSADLDVDRFAQWSWARDFAVGVAKPYSGKVKKAYIEEAKFYMTLPRAEWPCGVLLRLGDHEEHHPGCDTTDPLS